MDSEGYSGSGALLRYYQDALAHVTLLEEIAVRIVMHNCHVGG